MCSTAMCCPLLLPHTASVLLSKSITMGLACNASIKAECSCSSSSRRACSHSFLLAGCRLPAAPAPVARRSSPPTTINRSSCSRLLSRRSAAGDSAQPAVDFDALGLNLDELEMPDIDGDLRSFQERAGALFVGDAPVPSTFGNDDAAEDALATGAVVVDRSHWARIRVGGTDRLRFLGNLTTADVAALEPGQGCEMVLVTPQARCIELATAYVQGSGALLTFPGRSRDAVLAHLEKHVLYGDDVQLMDVGPRCRMFTVAGPGADEVLRKFGARDVGEASSPAEGGVLGAPRHAHVLLGFGGSPVVVAAGSGLASPGYTLIADEAVAGELWLALVSRGGAVPMGEKGWERQRVLQGVPASNDDGGAAELTDDANPLEVGLYHAVSLSKGCYMGQETLAKVSNLGAVKQALVGIATDAPVARGDAVTLLPSSDDGADSAADAPTRLGAVTSCTSPGQDGETGGFALAVVRCKAGGKPLALEGLQVAVGEAGVKGTVVYDSLAYPTRAFEDEAAAGAAAAAASGGSIGSEGAAADEQDEAAARAERLKKMQERLAAFQAQQGAAQ